MQRRRRVHLLREEEHNEHHKVGIRPNVQRPTRQGQSQSEERLRVYKTQGECGGCSVGSAA